MSREHGNGAAGSDGVRGLTATLVLGWVAIYTSGLSTEARTERRRVIEADLWDEAQQAVGLGESAGIGRQRVGRFLRGLSADLAWRFEQREQGSVAVAAGATSMPMILTVLVGGGILLDAAFVAALLSSPDFRSWEWMSVSLLGLGLSILGLLISIGHPLGGTALGLAGTVVLLAVMPWLAIAFAPVPVVLSLRLLWPPHGRRAVGS